MIPSSHPDTSEISNPGSKGLKTSQWWALAWQRLIAPPVFLDEDRTAQANLLNTLLWLIAFSSAMLSVQAYITNRLSLFFITIAVLVTTFVLQFVLRRGSVTVAAIALTTIMTLGIDTAILLYGTIRNPVTVLVPVTVLASGLLLGTRPALITLVFDSLVLGVLVWGELAGRLPRIAAVVDSPIVFLLPSVITIFVSTVMISLSSRNSRLALARARESEQLALRNASDLSTIRESLAELVEQRTRALQSRATQLQVAAEVGQIAATQRDLNQFLDKVTSLISQRLGFYHVGIFLLDERNEFAVLRAANSPGGKQMLEKGHKLRIGSAGIVGFTSATRRPRIALDVGQDSVHLKNPLLPETRSELALPMVVGQRIWGALDVQSTQQNAFNEEDVSTLQLLANQVAIAIENASLLSESQAALESTRRAYGELSRQAWLDRLRGQTLAYTRQPGGIQPLHTPPSAADEAHTLAIPIHVRGTLVGVIQARKPESASPWNPTEVQLVNTLVEQLSIALDSARLYEETQQRAELERQVSQISTRFRENLDLDLVLQTAVQEIYQALDLHDVSIQLSAMDSGSKSAQASDASSPPVTTLGKE